MTKKEIVRSISEKLNLTQLNTKDVVQNVLDCIIETLVAEERVELRNFGVFEVRKRAARKARNPQTGGEVLVKEKYVVAFKAGKALEDALQKKKRKRERKKESEVKRQTTDR
jgi:nucleoid DNA-binding protein